jgi:hypothetical protein
MIVVGVRVGQRHKSSAICVVETEERRIDGRSEDHFLVRHLERIPAGASFATIAKRVGEVTGEVYWRKESPPDVFVDTTGLGEPVFDLMQREAAHGWVLAVYMNHGDQRDLNAGVVKLGKAWLVTRLQTLLQDGRLHLPRTQDAEDLAEDLRAFEVNLPEGASDRPGAFKVGRHDDLVVALGLSVQEDPPRWTLSTLRYG